MKDTQGSELLPETREIIHWLRNIVTQPEGYDRLREYADTVADYLEAGTWRDWPIVTYRAATQGEPAAWMYEKADENPLVKRFFRQDIVDEGYSATPLYRHPPAPADREAIRRQAFAEAARIAVNYDTFDPDTIISANRASVAVSIQEEILALNRPSSDGGWEG